MGYHSDKSSGNVARGATVTQRGSKVSPDTRVSGWSLCRRETSEGCVARRVSLTCSQDKVEMKERV